MTTAARTVAVVDGGKSGLRVTVAGPEGRSRGDAPGFTYSTQADEIAATVDAIGHGLRLVSTATAIDCVCLGLTGLPGGLTERRHLAAGVAALVPDSEVILTVDGVLAHAGALGAPGVVISAGTGTAVLAIGDEGRVACLDGWGPAIGDRGSGYAIGLAGLRAAARALDGVGPATALVEAATLRLGGTDLAALQRFYRTPAPVPFIAGFAHAVAESASNGDRVSIEIWEDAASDLSATAAAAAARAGLGGGGRPVPVAVTGRLADAGAVLLQPLERMLTCHGLSLVAVGGDVTDGGIRLARGELATLYGTLITRYPKQGGRC